MTDTTDTADATGESQPEKVQVSGPDGGQVHPHGSLVEQVHRVWTTDQGVDPWVLAEETVRFLRDRIAREIRAVNRATRFGITAEHAAAIAENRPGTEPGDVPPYVPCDDNPCVLPVGHWGDHVHG